MFIGHYAVALAAKSAAPKTSLGTLLIAAQFLDLLWPVLLLAGVERVLIVPGNTVFTPLDFVSYPYSHSLLMAAVWATLFAIAYYFARRYSKGAYLIWLAVLSHWVLDLLTHRPDLPLAPGASRLVGFGLWNSFAGTLIVESLLFIIAFALYLKRTRAKDKIGSYGFWAFIIVLLIIYLSNAYGSPPPNTQLLALLALGQWLFVLWAYWVDRHRQALGI